MKKLNIKVKNAQGVVNTYEVEVEEVGGSVSLPSAPAVSAPVAAAPAAAPVAAPAGAETIKCPMPGTINKINVKAGDSVKKGDVLCVLEAMKMENDIKAGRDGVVAAVHVTQGASVNTDDALISLN